MDASQDEDSILMDMASLSISVSPGSDSTEQLHQAAAIFLDAVALNGVEEEIRALEVEHARFNHLEYLIQKVSIQFFPSNVASASRRRLIDFVAQHDMTISTTTQLSRGSIQVVNGEERLVIPIEDMPAVQHPVVSVTISGVAAASFPPNDHDNTRMASVEVTSEEDGIHATLRLSDEISIRGDFESSLSDINGGVAVYVMERFNIIPTFTPSSITIAVTPRLRRILQLLNKLHSPPDYFTDEDDIRVRVVAALGENEQRQLIKHYLQLKHENRIFAEFRNLILAADIYYPSGHVSLALDEGEYDGRDYWFVLLNEEARLRSVTAVSHISRVAFSFSGVRLEMNITQTLNIFQRDIDEFGPEVRGRLILVFTCRLCPSKKFLLCLKLNWQELTDEERAYVLDNFHEKVWNAIVGFRNVFPSYFKFTVVGIVCDVSLAGSYLNAVGLLGLD